MKLTGNETYSVKRGNRTVQARLLDMTVEEILTVANSGRVGNELPRALYAYQARRRPPARKRRRGGAMAKRVRKSTQIRTARKDAAQRKRAALEFQAPRRQGTQGGKGLSA